MIRPCALALALAATLTASDAAPARPKVSSRNQTGHAHHLLRAEKDLRAAQAAITGQNLKKAHKDVAAAIRQVEEAIHHHHKHHIAPTGQSTGNTPHHQHHAHLHRVVAELRVAEKELKNGATAQASKEIQKAEKTLQTAISSHKSLFGS